MIGIVLTGMLDDGTLGLWEIKTRGGIAIVQDPSDSAFPQMPQNAMANVPVDYSVPIAKMGPLLVSLSSQTVDDHRVEAEFAMLSEPTKYTCPDCHGPITRVKRPGDVDEYVCRVGHAYSPRAMLRAHEDTEERAWWAAIECLEEGADLAGYVAPALSSDEAAIAERRAREKRATARKMREVILRSQDELQESVVSAQRPGVR